MHQFVFLLFFAINSTFASVTDDSQILFSELSQANDSSVTNNEIEIITEPQILETHVMSSSACKNLDDLQSFPDRYPEDIGSLFSGTAMDLIENMQNWGLINKIQATEFKKRTDKIAIRLIQDSLGKSVNICTDYSNSLGLESQKVTSFIMINGVVQYEISTTNPY